MENQNLPQKINALNNFKKAYLELLENFDNEYMTEDYPFNESFDEIQVLNWIYESIKRINKNK